LQPPGLAAGDDHSRFVPIILPGRPSRPTVEQLGPLQTLGSSEAGRSKVPPNSHEFDPTARTTGASVEDASRNKMLALPSRNGINLPRFGWFPRSREQVHHSRHMHHCHGEQCAHEGQKTPPGNSERPRVPRGHNAVPSRERFHLFHRAVSNHDTAVHCSIGSFRGNCNPREPSLKSTHEKGSFRRWK